MKKSKKPKFIVSNYAGIGYDVLLQKPGSNIKVATFYGFGRQHAFEYAERLNLELELARHESKWSSKR